MANVSHCNSVSAMACLSAYVLYFSDDVCFDSFYRFRCSIMRINLSSHLVLGLVDFHFLLSILCMLLILSRLIRATISVFFVPRCPVLLSFYVVLSYMFELNKWR